MTEVNAVSVSYTAPGSIVLSREDFAGGNGAISFKTRISAKWKFRVPIRKRIYTGNALSWLGHLSVSLRYSFPSIQKIVDILET